MATQADHGAGIQASVRASDTRPATLPEIGIPRQRAAKMKNLAEAGCFNLCGVFWRKFERGVRGRG